MGVEPHEIEPGQKVIYHPTPGHSFAAIVGARPVFVPMFGWSVYLGGLSDEFARLFGNGKTAVNSVFIGHIELIEPAPVETWSASVDGENYHGEYESQAAAMAEAAPGGCVGRCVKIDPTDFVCVRQFLVNVLSHDDLATDWAAGYLGDLDADEIDDLETSLKTVLREWLDKTNRWPTFYNIDPESVVTASEAANAG